MEAGISTSCYAESPKADPTPDESEGTQNYWHPLPKSIQLLIFLDGAGPAVSIWTWVLSIRCYGPTSEKHISKEWKESVLMFTWIESHPTRQIKSLKYGRTHRVIAISKQKEKSMFGLIARIVHGLFQLRIFGVSGTTETNIKNEWNRRTTGVYWRPKSSYQTNYGY